MKTIVKFLFYQLVCPLLLFFKMDKLMRKRSNHRHLIIMYHGVSNKKNFSINGRHLPADEFEQHLRYYKNNFDIVSLDEICKTNGCTRARHCISLTFDDGYSNNIQNAVPLLLKYQIPATFFVSSIGLIDKEYLHPSDQIDLIAHAGPADVNINGAAFSRKNKKLLNKDFDAYQYINSLTFDEFKKTLLVLKRQFPFNDLVATIDPEVYKVVTSETVIDLASNRLFSVGSHSHDHVNLTQLSEPELSDQLAGSKNLLESALYSPVKAIAFPYGYFNTQVVKLSQQHGYEYLVAGGSVESEWKGLVLPRIGILNMAGYAFNMLSISRGFKKFGF